MNTLFEPLRIGKLELANRIIMAPMTRSRAGAGSLPQSIVRDYYEQRSSAGLIISEGVFPSETGKGYVRTPGMLDASHVDAWKAVTDAVHAKGGQIFMQIMHCGRISHPDMQPGGRLPLAPSTIKPGGSVWTDTGPREFVVPREVAVEEIDRIINDYGRAAGLAMDAGFDGVELHGAAGYLPEQFLSTGSNTRTDIYGGSVENRCRFMLQTLNAMVAACGSNRVGLKLSPEMNFNSVYDDNPVVTYSHLVKRLRNLELAYLHVALFGEPSVDYHALLRALFQGPYLSGGRLTFEKATAMIATGQSDAAVFGTLFIANPDLPERFRLGAELSAPDTATYYADGPMGYTDYPALDVL